MGRKSGASNLTNYHYLLKKYVDDDKTQLEEQRYFKTQGEIQIEYCMKRCSIYNLINLDESIQKKKYKNIEIIKLSPPIPIYSRVENIPAGIITV
tara:strand:- start:3110 stop:3394 length:285 start_codon:yes stop_codon:yes gene_type:complete